MHSAPCRSPAPPHPVMARPRMKTGELGAVARMTEPSSKIRMEKRLDCFRFEELVYDSEDRLQYHQANDVGRTVPADMVQCMESSRYRRCCDCDDVDVDGDEQCAETESGDDDGPFRARWIDTLGRSLLVRRLSDGFLDEFRLALVEKGPGGLVLIANSTVLISHVPHF